MYSFLLFLLVTTSLFIIIWNALFLAIDLYCTALTAKAHAYLHYEDKKTSSYHKDYKLVITDYILLGILYAICPFIINWGTFNLFSSNVNGYIKAYVFLLILMIIVWIISWCVNVHKIKQQEQTKKELIYAHVPVPRKKRDLILFKRTQRMPKHFKSKAVKNK